MTILETAVSLSNTGLVDGLSYHNFNSLHSRFRSSAMDKGIEKVIVFTWMLVIQADSSVETNEKTMLMD